MRDILLAGLLLIGLPITLTRPFVGVCIFAWLALMNPHKLTWGIAGMVPWSLIYGATTIASIAAHREGLFQDSLKRYTPVILYVLWMAITSLFAMHSENAWLRFEGILKVQIMCLLTLALLTSERRVHAFLAVIILSLSFYGLKGGIFTVLSGGVNRVWGPVGTILGDNNQLAAAFVILLPLLYWLHSVSKSPWQKRAIAFIALMCLFSIFGSHSRGAFLGVFLMAAFLWIKSDKKLPLLFLLPLALLVAAIFMPEAYWSRISTITEYQEDASALGRLNTWQTALNIANSRITGAGLEYYSREVFAIYAPNPLQVHSSHNIFFQALGEHGWIGFFLFLWIFSRTWRACSRLSSRTSTSQLRPDLLGRMTQVSLVGFSSTGFFVNIGNWDFMYYLVASVLALERLTIEPTYRKPTAGTREQESDAVQSSIAHVKNYHKYNTP